MIKHYQPLIMAITTIPQKIQLILVFPLLCAALVHLRRLLGDLGRFPGDRPRRRHGRRRLVREILQTAPVLRQTHRAHGVRGGVLALPDLGAAPWR